MARQVDQCEHRSPVSPHPSLGVAVTVGPFCCKKFCICKDYVVIPDTGELAEPMACDSSERLDGAPQPFRPHRQLAVPALQGIVASRD